MYLFQGHFKYAYFSVLCTFTSWSEHVFTIFLYELLFTKFHGFLLKGCILSFFCLKIVVLDCFCLFWLRLKFSSGEKPNEEKKFGKKCRFRIREKRVMTDEHVIFLLNIPRQLIERNISWKRRCIKETSSSIKPQNYLGPFGLCEQNGWSN